MTTPYEELQAEHQRLLGLRDAGTEPAELIEPVQQYIEQIKVLAEEIPAPRDRDQLRAILRFWANWVFERSGVYPDMTLRPALEMSVGPQMAEPPTSGAEPVDMDQPQDLAEPLPPPPPPTPDERVSSGCAGRLLSLGLPGGIPCLGIGALILLLIFGSVYLLGRSTRFPSPAATPTGSSGNDPLDNPTPTRAGIVIAATRTPRPDTALPSETPSSIEPQPSSTVGIPVTGSLAFSIIEVIPGDQITIQTYFFPPDEIFNVLMGPEDSDGIGGYLVGSLWTGAGGSFKLVYRIPNALFDEPVIALRFEGRDGSEAVDYFNNNQ